ncbi:HpcH/HpaI aldolase/citrate lyase family protein [Faucicola mancuniensis]|uniref:HpcH/HpaI aldolase/citrate lyase family protein n=1 Tax=Faucicola mancuniensis TaxID=1309795 RepID=UPI003977C009
MPTHTLAPTSYLFVPATHIERVAKAFDKGADAVIVDVEDGVSDLQKQQSWQNIVDYLKIDNNPPIWLRINAVQSEFFNNDNGQLQRLKNTTYFDKISGIVLPKVQSVDDIQTVFFALNKPIIGLIENAQGMANIANIATAQGLQALSFGFLDICEQLNVVANSTSGEMLLNQLRYQLSIHSKINNLQAPIEGVFANFHDKDLIRQRVIFWQNLGFSAMFCIHPNQVAIVNELAKISEKQLIFAKRVVDYYQQTGSFAFAIDGEMVDLPVIKQAFRLL